MTDTKDLTTLGKLVPASYLVTTYLDMKDVMDTVENMIAHSEYTRYPTSIRKLMRIRIIPLKETSGYLFQLSIPEKILGKR